MEITKKGRFITEFKGGQPAMGATGVLEKYMEDAQDKALLSFAETIKKKSQKIEDVIVDILSVFNRNGGNEPVIGNWMVRGMLLSTADAIFNKKDNKHHPSKKTIPVAIGMVKPINIQIFRDKELIKKSDFVTTHTVSLKDRSFFKAYESIKEGAEFEITMSFNETLISKECVDLLLENAQYVGLGAYRARYGKFEWV